MAVPDDLATLKDDMVAFTEGHGMRRFPGYVDHEEVQTVMWKAGDDADSWKDFVELAKTSGSPFLTMDSWHLEKEELEGMIQRLSNAEFTSDEDLEDAQSCVEEEQGVDAPDQRRRQREQTADHQVAANDSLRAHPVLRNAPIHP